MAEPEAPAEAADKIKTMPDQPQHPIEPSPEHHKDIEEDPHFHDDDDLVRQDDVDRPNWRPPARRKPGRKLPPQRHYED